MSEAIHKFATNYLVVVPLAMVVMLAWFKWEKMKNPHPAKKNVMTNPMMYRLAMLSGLLTFFIVWANKPLPPLEESIIVSPADF